MKTLLLTCLIISMALIATSSIAQSTSGSASEMPMHDTMSMPASMNHQNMSDMGQLMMKMSNAMEKRPMNDEQRIQCARIMNKLAKTMMNCAADVELKNVDKHKNEIKEITEEWDYFESDQYKYDGN